MDGELAARAVEVTALWRLGTVVNMEDKRGYEYLPQVAAWQ
jgi:hypothetical protein